MTLVPRLADNPMHVAHLIPDLDIGGAENALLNLLRRMDKSRIRSSVVCLGGKGVLDGSVESLGVPVFNLGLGLNAAGILRLPSFMRLMKKLDPDLIQGWMYHGNLSATFASYLLHRGRPVLWNVRGPGTSLSRRPGKMGVYRFAALLSRTPDRIVNVSRASAEIHERVFRYPRDRWVFIPNGIDTELFRPDRAARDGFRALLAVSPAAPLIGIVARYDPMKDHDNFLAAAATLVRDGIDAHFVLIGPGMDRGNIELARKITDRGLADRAHLLGARRDIPSLTAGFDIGCLSSYGEGLPNVVGEMMSCGVPCVVTDVGDCRRVVGDTGKVVPARDPERLATALKELIDVGADARQELGAKARQRVIENFSLGSVVARYEELYEQVFLEHRAH